MCKYFYGLLLLVFLLSGCVSRPSWQKYKNPEIGIEFEKPSNWDVTFYDRSSTVVLKAKNWIGNNATARVEIQGNACIPVPVWFENSHEEIKLNINRIQALYNLDAVTRIQEPFALEYGENEVVKAIIAIPTMSFSENDERNQLGIQDTDLFQIIEMFAIKNKDYFIMAYIYKGNSEELNTEAEEIVASIQLVCSK